MSENGYYLLGEPYLFGGATCQNLKTRKKSRNQTWPHSGLLGIGLKNFKRVKFHYCNFLESYRVKVAPILAKK